MKTLASLIITIALIVAGIYGFFIIGAEETEAKVNLSMMPEKVMQGEPLQIKVTGARSRDKVTVTFASSTVPLSTYNTHLVGFVPIDIAKKTGSYEIIATVKNAKGRTIQTVRKSIEVLPRVKYEAPLGIPQKLGGNTAASQKQLIDTLAIENASLLDLGSATTSLWNQAFAFPVKNPYITDPYGYSRLTGAYTITHKGTDFRAPIGTEIYAVNDGEVRLARLGRNYGNTIVIDHGNKVQSFYMHLSRMDVQTGDSVKKGQLIGLSGMTGYAEAPHLHFTLRINDISVDPVIFLEFFKK